MDIMKTIKANGHQVQNLHFIYISIIFNNLMFCQYAPLNRMNLTISKQCSYTAMQRKYGMHKKRKISTFSPLSFVCYQNTIKGIQALCCEFKHFTMDVLFMDFHAP